jgi:hypothetical protein
MVLKWWEGYKGHPIPNCKACGGKLSVHGATFFCEHRGCDQFAVMLYAEAVIFASPLPEDAGPPVSGAS